MNDVSRLGYLSQSVNFKCHLLAVRLLIYNFAHVDATWLHCVQFTFEASNSRDYSSYGSSMRIFNV